MFRLLGKLGKDEGREIGDLFSCRVRAQQLRQRSAFYIGIDSIVISTNVLPSQVKHPIHRSESVLPQNIDAAIQYLRNVHNTDLP